MWTLRRSRACGGVSAPPDPNSPANKIRLDVHVTSAPQLDFQNSYAKLAGTVDLTVRGTIAVPSMLGRIQITDGSATFAGTKYQLQRGTIYFTNPVRIDPIIDLDATARVENYDITIGLHGTINDLEADVSVGAAAERGGHLSACWRWGARRKRRRSTRSSRCRQGAIRRRARCWAER